MFFYASHVWYSIKEYSSTFESIDVFSYSFGLYFTVYAFVYSLVQFKILSQTDFKNFTYISSTINALYCIWRSLGHLLLKDALYDDIANPFDFYHDQQFGNWWLMSFAAYLINDGLWISVTCDLTKPATWLNLLHHFLGGLGIFLISYWNIAYTLGLFFAYTELSTPLINCSWWLYKTESNKTILNIIYVCAVIVFFFARFISLPVIYYWIRVNEDIISKIGGIVYWYVYLGVNIMTLLNTVWMSQLFRKFLN